MFQECRHIMPSGARCHSPALREAPYCYFHARLHRLTPRQLRFQDEPLELPPLEDRGAIQIALAQVLGALASSRLDPRRAGLMLYGLQIASKTVPSLSRVLDSEAVRALSYDSDGGELAEEHTACEPPDDCCDCPKKDTCDDYEQ